MLTINSVISPSEAHETTPIAETLIVIWADSGTDRLFLMPLLGRPRKPQPYSYRMVQAWVDDAIVLPGELRRPKQVEIDDNRLPPASRRVRDEHWAVIKPLVENLEAYLVPTYGKGLVAQRARETGKTPGQVNTYMYRYFRGGQTLAALTPHYVRRGLGQERTYGKKKVGRPPTKSAWRRRNVNRKDLRNIKRILKRHYVKEDGLSLTACYQRLRDTFYVKAKSFDVNNVAVYDYFDECEIPSWDQFYHHAKKFRGLIGHDLIARKRLGGTVFDKDRAGRSGDAPIPSGPGQYYQLDATPHDFQLTSPLSPTREPRVGRATLYVVIDAYSGMRVGLHLTLAPPSWDAARQALFNAFRSKVDYCRELGLEIDPAQWPVDGVPQGVFVDNGELQNSISEPGVQDLGYEVIFGRVARGDDKGLVENAVKAKNRAVEYLPGFMHKNAEGRRTDARAEAVLTLRELYRLLLLEVLHQNNIAGCDERYLDQAMIADGVKAVPREIWLWGERHQPFMRKAVPEPELYLKMMEKGTASVHQQGIYFGRRWYRSDWTLAQGLQDRKKNRNKAVPIEVRHTRHNCNFILLVTPDGLSPAYLQGRDRRLADAHNDDVEARLNEEAMERDARSRSEFAGRAGIIEHGETLVEKARAEQQPLSRAQIHAQDIPANRSAALDQEMRAEGQRAQRYFEQVHGAPPAPETPPPAAEAPEDDDRRSGQHNAALENLLEKDSDDDNC